MSSFVYLVVSWILCFAIGFGTALVLLPSNWPRERILLAPVLGAGVLVWLSGFLSYCGLSMRTAAPIICICGIATSAAGVWIAHRRHEFVFKSSGTAAYAHVLGLIGGSSALASIFLYHAWNPYTDAFTYISIADFLQNHSFLSPAIPGATHPVLTQVFIYQQGGYRMGSNFLLSFFAALFHADYSFDVYMPVLSLGLWLAVPGFWVFCRRALFMPALATVFATMIFALHTGIPITNAEWGFMPEAWGFVFMLPFLALYMRAGNGCDRIRRIIATGVFGGLLLLTYTEIVPFILLFVALYSTHRIWHREIRRRAKKLQLTTLIPFSTLAYVAGPILVAMAIAPLATWHFIPVIIRQSHAVVGGDIHLSALDYIGMLSGFRSLAETDILSPGILGTIWRLAALTATTIVLVTAIRGPRRVRLQIGSLAIPFILALLWFGLYATNPWEQGKVGQPWDIYKLITYSFFLFVALWGCGLAVLWKGYGFNRLLALAQVLAFLAFFPVATVRTARVQANQMEVFTGTRVNPIVQYKRIPSMLRSIPQDLPVNLLIPSEEGKHQQLVAYFMHRPVIADWSEDGYVWPHMDHSKPFQVQSEYPTLYYDTSEGPGTVAHLKLIPSAGIGVMVAFGPGWWSAEQDGKNRWRWLQQRGEIDLTVIGKGGWLTLTGELAVANKQRTITISVNDQPEITSTYTLPPRWFEPFTWTRVYLSGGRHQVFISADGPPGGFLHDPREIRIGVRNLIWKISADKN